MRKFINYPLFSLAIFTSILAGLETPFNTFSYSFFFYLIEKKHLSWIIPTIIGMILVFGLFALLNYWKNWTINRNIYAINTQLKTRYVLHSIAATTLSGPTESDHVSFFMNDLKLLEDNYWRQVFSLIGSVVMVLGTLSYALYSNVLVTLIFLGFMIIPTLTPKLFSKTIQAKTTAWSQKNQTLSGTVHDLFHGARLLKRYSAVTGFNGRLHRSLSAMEHANADLKNRIALSNSVINFLFMLFSDIPIGIGLYFTITGRLHLSQFVAIQFSSSWILNGFNQIVSGWNTLNSTQEIRQTVLNNVAVPAKASDRAAPTVATLALNHVTFAYPQAPHPIFHQLNLHLKAGDKVLIRGQSGIGKSTLIRLLLKEVFPTSGQVLVNQQDYTPNNAYQWFGVVGQTPIIFQDTVQANVTLGQSATPASISTALTMAGLPELAAHLNTPVRENGANFSGGQLKRLEIARALFFNRRVLLIDEGTASLDPATALSIHRQILKNPHLTVIEVDHHIPAEILPWYSSIYDLQAGHLVQYQGTNNPTQ